MHTLLGIQAIVWWEVFECARKVVWHAAYSENTKDGWRRCSVRHQLCSVGRALACWLAGFTLLQYDLRQYR